jgi:hypothetical protein
MSQLAAVEIYFDVVWDGSPTSELRTAEEERRAV